MFSFLKPREQPQLLTCSFDQNLVYSAGSEITGVVHFKPDPTITELRVSMRGGQHSTYEGPPLSGGNRPMSDIRFDVAVYFHEFQLLWSKENGSALASPDGSIDLRFRFKLPTMEQQREDQIVLPPSFEGGTRPPATSRGKGRIEGNQIGSTLYLIKVEAARASDPAKGAQERLLLPFIYLPPETVSSDLVPPPIFPPPATAESSLPIFPPPRPRDEDGWRTSRRVQVVKEGLLRKPGALEITLHTPDLPAFPTSHPIPFYLHLLVLSPPALPTSPPPQLRIPSPSSISLTLDRLVLARAQGFQQVSLQQGAGDGLSVVDLSKEKRVWYGEIEYREQEEETSDGGRTLVGRWCRGVSIVGEMKFEGTSVGPSFTRGPKDLLGCSWTVSLHIPQKGVGTDVTIDKLLPVVLSSRVTRDETTEGSWEGGRMEFPPSYFEAAGGRAPQPYTGWVEPGGGGGGLTRRRGAGGN